MIFPPFQNDFLSIILILAKNPAISALSSVDFMAFSEGFIAGVFPTGSELRYTCDS
jgi:hypothetical protein